MCTCGSDFNIINGWYYEPAIILNGVRFVTFICTFVRNNNEGDNYKYIVLNNNNNNCVHIDNKH